MRLEYLKKFKTPLVSDVFDILVASTLNRCDLEDALEETFPETWATITTKKLFASAIQNTCDAVSGTRYVVRHTLTMNRVLWKSIIRKN